MSENTPKQQNVQTSKCYSTLLVVAQDVLAMGQARRGTKAACQGANSSPGSSNFGFPLGKPSNFHPKPHFFLSQLTKNRFTFQNMDSIIKFMKSSSLFKISQNLTI